MNSILWSLFLTNWLILAGKYVSCTSDDESLRRALNEIAYRQRQLAPSYYVTANNQPTGRLHENEEQLMFLVPPSSEFADNHRESVTYGFPKQSIPKNIDLIDDELTQDAEVQDREKYLKERLLERLMLDYLKDDEDPRSRARGHNMKRSFFRERGESASPETLQALYESGDNSFYMPSQFRERSKIKLFEKPHPRLVQSFDSEDEDENTPEDYIMALNALWEKYRDPSAQRGDPENITEEDVEEFMKYLAEKEELNRQKAKYRLGDDYINSVSAEKRFNLADRGDAISYLKGNPSSAIEVRPARSKRYWLGSEEKVPYNSISSSNEITIKKRSPGLSVERFTRNSSDSTKKEHEKLKFDNNKQNLNTSKTKLSDSHIHVSKKLTDHGAKQEKQEIKKFIKGVPKSNSRLVTEGNLSAKPLKISKKSVDWSNYFGIDKRQSKPAAFTNGYMNRNDFVSDQYMKPNLRQIINYPGIGGHGIYKSMSPRTNEDLKAAEDAIIDNVLKYTGAHQGVTDSRELENFKESVIGQLAAAYNLERMRKEMNIQEQLGLDIPYDAAPESVSKQISSHDQFEGIAQNGVADKERFDEINSGKVANMKKENPQSSSTPASRFDVSKMKKTSFAGDDFQETKKKSNIFTNEVTDECPVLEDVVKKCYNIINLAGDYDDSTFLPFCVIHQICEICGATNEDYEESCDVNFISQSVMMCGDAPLCQYTARRILNTMHGQKKSFAIDTCDSCLATSLQKLLVP